jgi:hypothetical protein
MKIHGSAREAEAVPRPVSPEHLDSLRSVLKGPGALQELMAERARDRKREDDGY